MLWLGTLDVDLSSEYVRMSDVVNQMLGHPFVFEHYKAEPARLACMDVLQNDRVFYLAKLREMLQKVVLGQFEVQAANKNLAFRVLKGEVLLTVLLLLVMCNDNVRIRLVLIHHHGLVARPLLVHHRRVVLRALWRIWVFFVVIS